MEQCQHVVLNENIDQTLLNKLHGPIHYKIGVTCVCIQWTHVVLNENIDQTLLNKLHGPIHYKIGVTCVCIQRTHVLYFVVITQQSNSPISQSSRLQ